jgi:hypothetical protein
MSENKPLISEQSEPLTHIVGNEFDLCWRSVWIHTPRESIRIVYTPEGIETIIRPRRTDVAVEVSGLESEATQEIIHGL